MKKIIIFYSWQSDLPKECNQDFIQKALDEAVREICNDGDIEVEPVVERDTKGVAGAPDIANTIFHKIDQCDIFVADVSIINPKSELRNTPNPNVLIELGYALKKLGYIKIIMIQNIVFGKPESLPFDLKTKRILEYELAKVDKTLEEKQNELKRRIKEALVLILEEIKKEKKDDFPLDVDLSYKKTSWNQERHDCQLRVHLKNNGKISIETYEVTLEIPSGIVYEPRQQVFYIPQRSDNRYCFFRVTEKEHRKEIYSGDTLDAMSVSYFIDNNSGEFYDDDIRVTARVPGYESKVIERKVREFQNF